MRLAWRGDLDGAGQILRTPADAGGGQAAQQLGNLLAKRGDLDALRARADAGDQWAGGHLPGLLTKQGRAEEAERLERSGLNPDGQLLAGNRRMLRALYAAAAGTAPPQHHQRRACSCRPGVVRDNGALPLITRWVSCRKPL